MANGNGSTGGKLLWWGLGLLGPVLVGAWSGTLTHIQLHSEAIAVLQSQNQATERRLQQIEDKLDRLLQRLSGR